LFLKYFKINKIILKYICYQKIIYYIFIIFYGSTIKFSFCPANAEKARLYFAKNCSIFRKESRGNVGVQHQQSGSQARSSERRLEKSKVKDERLEEMAKLLNGMLEHECRRGGS